MTVLSLGLVAHEDRGGAAAHPAMNRLADCHPRLSRLASVFGRALSAGRGIGVASVRGMKDGRRGRNRLLLGFKTRTRVLVADEDEQMRALLLQVLTEEGYEVVEAADGDELIDLLRSDGIRPMPANVDAVIADIEMAGAEGLELLGALGANDCPIPIILVSALLDDDFTSREARLGAAAVFSKPFVLRELISTMRRLLPARPA